MTEISNFEENASRKISYEQASDDFVNESIGLGVDPLEPVDVSEILQSDPMFDETYLSADLVADDVDDLVFQKSEVVDAKKPVYKEPVTRPKPQVPVKAQAKTSVRRTVPLTKTPLSKKELKRDQMEINFGVESDLDNAKIEGSAPEDKSIPAFSAIDEAPAKKPQVDPEVIVLSVVMPENQIMSGAALLPSLLTMGMKYGDMNIFHRHQDNAGNGKVTFSLANMMNPGTFDLDSMESFATQGVSLFMTLPNAGDPFEVFEQMLSAAKQLSHEFSGQLLDDKRSMMTKQTEQHYIGKIRDFERKNRIISV